MKKQAQITATVTADGGPLDGMVCILDGKLAPQLLKVWYRSVRQWQGSNYECAILEPAAPEHGLYFWYFWDGYRLRWTNQK